MPETKKSSTRRTSDKKVTVKVKPTKTKKVRQKGTRKGNGSTTATAAFNTYKSVKQKIVGTKESREEKRLIKSVVGDDFQIPKLGKVIDDEDEQPVRKSGKGIFEKELKYSINPVTRKRDYDSAEDSVLLGSEKELEEVTVSAKRKPMYLLIAVALIFLFLQLKKK